MLLLLRLLLLLCYLLLDGVVQGSQTRTHSSYQLLLFTFFFLEKFFVKSQLRLQSVEVSLRLLFEVLKHLYLSIKRLYDCHVPVQLLRLLL